MLNIVILVLSLLALSQPICANTSSKKFILITTLYNEKNVQRAAEFLMCLEKNLQHHLIEKIHILYDTAKDDDTNFLFHYLQTRPVAITLIQGRPTYGECFKLANTAYPQSKIIVSNADIFYNQTLDLLENYDLTSKFLTITRSNVLRDGSIQKLKVRGLKKRARYMGSHDTWIFSTPLKLFLYDDIKMGIPACDNALASVAEKSGYKVLNPCLTMQCCHLHLTRLKNYTRKENYNHLSQIIVPWSELKP